MNIEAVKKKHELQLMQIPGVEGVGITDRGGKACIVVYVSDKNAAQKKLPPQLEGVPLIIESTGSFSAF